MSELICSYYTLAGVSPAEAMASPRTFAARVEAAALAGYTGIGIHIRDYRSLRAAGQTDGELRAILRDHDITHVELEFLLNWFSDGEAGAISRADESVFYHMYETFGARVMFLGGDLQPGNAMEFNLLVDRFGALCERASAHGAVIGLEPCAWSNIGTLDEALALLDATAAANAGLFLDLWHLYRRNLDFGRLDALRPEQIVGVQLDDAAAHFSEPLIADCLDHRLLPGEGDADAAGFVNALQGVGLNCPISVEIISTAQRARPLREAASSSFAAASAAIGTSGSGARPAPARPPSDISRKLI